MVFWLIILFLVVQVEINYRWNWSESKSDEIFSRVGLKTLYLLCGGLKSSNRDNQVRQTISFKKKKAHAQKSHSPKRVESDQKDQAPPLVGGASYQMFYPPYGAFYEAVCCKYGYLTRPPGKKLKRTYTWSIKVKRRVGAKPTHFASFQ